MRAPLRPAAIHCAPASAASPLVPPPSGLLAPWLKPRRRRRVLWYHSNDRDDDVEADAFRGRRRPPLRPQQPQPQLSVQQSYFAVHNDAFWQDFVWWHNWHIHKLIHLLPKMMNLDNYFLTKLLDCTKPYALLLRIIIVTGRDLVKMQLCAVARNGSSRAQTRQKAEARKSGQTFAPAVNRSTFQDVFKARTRTNYLLETQA